MDNRGPPKPKSTAHESAPIGVQPVRSGWKTKSGLAYDSLRASVERKLQHTATKDYLKDSVDETLDETRAILDAHGSLERWVCVGRCGLAAIIMLFLMGTASLWHVDEDLWTI